MQDTTGYHKFQCELLCSYWPSSQLPFTSHPLMWFLLHLPQLAGSQPPQVPPTQRWRRHKFKNKSVRALCFCSVTQLCPTVCKHSLSVTISRGLPKFMSIALVMPSSHLILWRPLLLQPSIFSSIRDFSNESAVHIKWPKYWGFSFSISPSNEFSGLISLKIDCWFSCL